MKFYVIDPVETGSLHNSEGYNAFVKSPWAGQGYGRKHEANEVRKFLEKKFNIKFIISVEEI